MTDKPDSKQIDELTGKGALHDIAKHYTGVRNKAASERDRKGAIEADKKVGRAWGMISHNAAKDAAEKTFPNLKGKVKYPTVKGPKYKAEEIEQVDEKHLTPAEKVKREQIAKSIAKSHPEYPMGKKMAIATAQAKKVAEEVQIAEVGDTSKGKAALKSYVKKALDTGSEKSVSNLASRGGFELGLSPTDDMSAGIQYDKKAVVRSKGVMNAVKRLT